MLTLLAVVLVTALLLAALTRGTRSLASVADSLATLIYRLNARFFPEWWKANRERIARQNPRLTLPP